jgi:hypothetical protein
LGATSLSKPRFSERCFSERLVYLSFGIAVLAFGAAALVPRNRTRLVGLLRIGGVDLMVLTLAVRVVRLVASAA